MTPPQKRYRCCYCGRALPAWLPVAQEPEGPMLWHHLSLMHPAEVGPCLARMRTEDIGTSSMPRRCQRSAVKGTGRRGRLGS
jgi:hypothetical protein